MTQRKKFYRTEYIEYEMTRVKMSLTQYVATGESITLYILQHFVSECSINTRQVEVKPNFQKAHRENSSLINFFF